MTNGRVAFTNSFGKLSDFKQLIAVNGLSIFTSSSFQIYIQRPINGLGNNLKIVIFRAAKLRFF